jgi:hypothetical protein
MMGTTVAFTADPLPTAQAPIPSKEMRVKMATLHEQMAVCLRSDKPFAECRTQMMQSCQSTIGAQGCPIMGMGSGPMGMHGGMMQGQSSSSDSKK